MDNILIIGAGDFQLPLVQRASLSYNVLLAAPVISDAFKPYISDSLLIDVRDKEGILDYAGEHSICGVITDQTDIAVRSVAYVAQELGLPGIGYETGCLFTDKSLMRARMAELGIKLLPNRSMRRSAEMSSSSLWTLREAEASKSAAARTNSGQNMPKPPAGPPITASSLSAVLPDENSW